MSITQTGVFHCWDSNGTRRAKVVTELHLYCLATNLALRNQPRTLSYFQLLPGLHEDGAQVLGFLVGHRVDQHSHLLEALYLLQLGGVVQNRQLFRGRFGGSLVASRSASGASISMFGPCPAHSASTVSTI